MQNSDKNQKNLLWINKRGLTLSEFTETNMPPQVIRNYNTDILRNSPYGSWQYWFCEAVRLGDESILTQVQGISEDTESFLRYNWAICHFAEDHHKTVERQRPNGEEYTHTLFYHKTLGGSVTWTVEERRKWKIEHLQKCAKYMPQEMSLTILG